MFGSLCYVQRNICDIINILVFELPNKSQAALPQGIVPFVFAKEYNVHPDILSTGSVNFILKQNQSIVSYLYPF